MQKTIANSVAELRHELDMKMAGRSFNDLLPKERRLYIDLLYFQDILEDNRHIPEALK